MSDIEGLPRPWLAGLLVLLAVVALGGGTVGALVVYDEPEMGLPALTLLVQGVVAFAIFMALSSVVTDVHRILITAREIAATPLRSYPSEETNDH